ncbi:MAG: cysteine desulfurase [Lachnospiraceae bacterium]|nr:cysteine desulfurase [Lachnospiraceae bacterium]
MDFRKDFNILQDDYIYFDNAATSQRPAQVTEAMRVFNETANANPLRGLYDWAIAATDAYEEARAQVARFLNAPKAQDIIFTRNTTEAINLVAYSYGLSHVQEGDEIVLSVMEHHSNILPWQMVAREKKARLVYLEPDEEGILQPSEYEGKITEKTKIVAIGHVSNVLGVTNPVKEIVARAHAVGAVALVDGAQAVPHMRVDVRDIDADFYAISGHKMLGPFGIGALYGRTRLLEEMPPFLTGGEMIEYVERETSTYAELPHKFEAGTVNAQGAVGMAAAIKYLEEVGYDTIKEIDHRLTTRLMEGMKKVPHVHIFGSPDPARHNGIVTFTIDDVHPHDISSVLNEDKVCIRAGHHCAQVLMQFLNVNSTARASLYFYNTEEEVDRFLAALAGVRGVMGL